MLNVGDKICVHYLHEHQDDTDKVPFTCTIKEVNDYVDGFVYAVSDSTGILHDLDPTQFTLVSDETYD